LFDEAIGLLGLILGSSDDQSVKAPTDFASEARRGSMREGGCAETRRERKQRSRSSAVRW
jgi:hypothetical protein